MDRWQTVWEKLCNVQWAELATRVYTGGNLPLWTTYGKVKYGHLLDTRTRPIIISGCVLKKKQNIMWNLILS